MLVACSYQISFCFCSLLRLCRSLPALRPCEEISAWLGAPDSTFRPVAPSPPSAGARRPQKRWLDSREALILQLRQSRLHRWVSRPPLLFNCSGLGKLFFTPFYLCWFSAWGFSPPKRALICTNTKQRCEAAPRAPWGGFSKSWWDCVFVGSVDLFDSDSRCGLLDCVKRCSRISERGSAEWIKIGALHEMLV